MHSTFIMMEGGGGIQGYCYKEITRHLLPTKQNEGLYIAPALPLGRRRQLPRAAADGRQVLIVCNTAIKLYIEASGGH